MDGGFDRGQALTGVRERQAKELQNYIKARVKVERDYAKALRKVHSHSLAVQTTIRSEIGSVAGHLDDREGSSRGGLDLYQGMVRMMSECETMAEERSVLADRLETDLLQPYAASMKSLEATRSSIVVDGGRYANELKEVFKRLGKAQSSFDKAREDFEKAEAQATKVRANPKAKSKELNKVQSKLEAAAAKRDAAEAEFAAIESRSLVVQEDHFNVRMPSILRSFQAYEDMLFASTKDLLQRASDTVSESLDVTLGAVADIHVDIGAVTSRINVFDTATIEADQEQAARSVTDVSPMAILNADMRGRMRMCSSQKLHNPKFSEYFFILVGPERLLYFFERENSSSAKGVLNLAESDRAVFEVDDSLFNRRNVIRLSCIKTVGAAAGSSDYYLMVDRDVEYNQWVSHLRSFSGGGRNVSTHETRFVDAFTVKVSEAKGLSKRDNYFCHVRLDGDVLAATPPCTESSDTPFWSEEFLFDEVPLSTGAIFVDLFTRKGKLVGEFMVPRSALVPGTKWEEWTGADSPADCEARLRFSVKYESDVVRPLADYERLLQAVETPAVLAALNVVIDPKDREITARHMLLVEQERGAVLSFVLGLVYAEIFSTTTSNIIFRGNSLTTKALDQFMKLVGMDHLHFMLSGPINHIVNANKDCEVDAARLDDGTDTAKRWRQLMEYMNEMWDSILHSADGYPESMRVVFHYIQGYVHDQFGAEADERVRYTAVSGFLFLRYIVPAILSPKLFDIVPELPNTNAARTLTLVAKTIQNLANLVGFGEKEPYMADMNGFIEENQDRLKRFIDDLSAPPRVALDIPIDIPVDDAARHACAIHATFLKLEDALREAAAGEEWDPACNIVFEALDELAATAPSRDQQAARLPRTLSQTRPRGGSSAAAVGMRKSISAQDLPALPPTTFHTSASTAELGGPSGVDAQPIAPPIVPREVSREFSPNDLPPVPAKAKSPKTRSVYDLKAKRVGSQRFARSSTPNPVRRPLPEAHGGGGGVPTGGATPGSKPLPIPKGLAARGRRGERASSMHITGDIPGLPRFSDDPNERRRPPPPPPAAPKVPPKMPMRRQKSMELRPRAGSTDGSPNRTAPPVAPKRFLMEGGEGPPKLPPKRVKPRRTSSGSRGGRGRSRRGSTRGRGRGRGAGSGAGSGSPG